MKSFINTLHKTNNALMFAISTRKNVKSKDRIMSWLKGHNFLLDRFSNSDIIRFIERCPLSQERRALTIHNAKPDGTELTLVLKNNGNSICFKLKKIEEGFLIKHSSEKAWIFNKRGALSKRTEHKKVKLWLEARNIDVSSDQSCDLLKVISSCPLCKSDKPLRFHRCTDEELDLQCGCINYFRLVKEDDRYVLVRRGEILAAFNLKGDSIPIIGAQRLNRRSKKNADGK